MTETMKTFDKETNQRIVKIASENIKDYRDKIIHNPQQHLSNAYTTEDVGGSNLTIGEMVDKAKTTKLFGGCPTRLTVKDDSDATLYVIDLKKV